jgi:hypothetical protein
MRQRISRLVRKTLSFSKKLENHIGAIWYFIHHYNASLFMYEIFHYIFTTTEYGFRQSKSELGWADFRVTQSSQIEKWWEILCSAYLMLGLYTSSNTAVNSQASSPSTSSAKNGSILHRFEQHPDA